MFHWEPLKKAAKCDLTPRKTHTFWTLETTSGLRVKLRLRKMLLNKCLPSKIGSIREHYMVSNGANINQGGEAHSR